MRIEKVAADSTDSLVNVNHPSHYGGKNNPFETIKVIKAFSLNFNLGNALKYISRAGKKNNSTTIEDLMKALWYVENELADAQRELTIKTPPMSVSSIESNWNLHPDLISPLRKILYLEHNYQRVLDETKVDLLFRLKDELSKAIDIISKEKNARQ